MNVLCNLLGHKFKHAPVGHKSTCTQFLGSLDNPVRTYDALYVVKVCQRCGYEHADTFEIKGTEKKA